MLKTSVGLAAAAALGSPVVAQATSTLGNDRRQRGLEALL